MTNDSSATGQLHRETFDLLPWFLTGRLDPSAMTRTAAHLEACAECRGELAAQRSLQAAMAAVQPRECAPQPTFARLMARLDAPEPAPTPAAPLGRDRRTSRRGLALGMAAAVLLGIGAMMNHYTAPRFVTATSPAAPPDLGHALRLVVVPDLSLRAFESLLRVRNLRIVDGPTPQHAWTVAAPAGVDGAQLQRLVTDMRTDPRVRLLEPLPPSPPR